MSPRNRLLALLAAVSLCSAGMPAAEAAALQRAATAQSQRGAVELRFKGRNYPLEEPPAEVGDAVLAALGTWAPLAEREGWNFALDRGLRVLLVTPRRNHRKVDGYLTLIENVARDIDALLPLPEREPQPDPQTGSGGSAPRDPGIIPEDPEEEPPEPIGGPAGSWTTSWTWGLHERVLERDIAVLFVLDNEAQVSPVLTALSELQPYLKPWLPSARDLTGWVLEQPLAGLCYEWPSGVEEWEVKNEIVHRTAELFTLRRFGPLPSWLVQGLAWTVEFRIQKTIYCFPGRSDFVYVTEHTSWPLDLKRRFEGRDAAPVGMQELNRLRPNHYDVLAAPLAWGLVNHLSALDPKKLSALAEDLRLDYEQGSRVDHGNGSWSRDATYTTPEDVQERLLLEHFGDKVLADFQRQAARGNTRARR